MRILVLSNLYPPHYIGGYELACATVTNALRARSHVVHVLTSDHGIKPGGQVPAENGVERRLRIHGFFGHPWLGIGPLRALEFHNNDVLRETLRRFKPEVCHVYNLGGISKSLTMTLQREGLPVAYWIMDHWIARSLAADVWLDWWNRRASSVAQRGLRAVWTLAGCRRRWDGRAPTNPLRHLRFQRIVFCSRSLREFTAAKGYDVAHGDVIYPSVNIARFCGEPSPSSNPMRRLLYAGRLTEDKGVMTTLRALARIRDRFRGTLRLCGDGEADYRAKLEAFIREQRLAVEIFSAPPEQMPQVYRDHDALLFPSEWPEPFGLTRFEAMACGRPVISTTTGAGEETLREGDNALTYAAGDADALSLAILRLQDDAELRVRLARNGQEDVRRRYAEPIIVSQVENYLRETVANWKPAPPSDYTAP